MSDFSFGFRPHNLTEVIVEVKRMSELVIKLQELEKQLELSQKREAILKEALKDLANNYLFGNGAVYGDIQKALKEGEEIK